MLVGRKSLQGANVYRTALSRFPAIFLARRSADSAANRNQRVCLPGNEVGFLIIPFADGSYVSLGIGCQGAGALTCHQGLIILDPQNFNLIFTVEVSHILPHCLTVRCRLPASDGCDCYKTCVAPIPRSNCYQSRLIPDLPGARILFGSSAFFMVRFSLPIAGP